MMEKNNKILRWNKYILFLFLLKNFRPKSQLWLFHDGGPYIETSFSANQWTGFYMIGTEIMKELEQYKSSVNLLVPDV